MQFSSNSLTDYNILFAENASALSRILFKDSELKKMERMDNFIKVNSDVIIQQL